MPRSLPASIANSRFFGIGEISELVLCRTRPFYLFTSHRQNTFRSRLRHIPCTASYCLIIFPGNRRIFQEVSFKKYETFNAIQTERHYARVRKQPRPCRADAGPRASYPNGSSRRFETQKDKSPCGYFSRNMPPWASSSSEAIFAASASTSRANTFKSSRPASSLAISRSLNF
jgi:hypothetical protein